jgi:hypothetical protein
VRPSSSSARGGRPIKQIAREPDVSYESLRLCWVKHAEVDAGERAGLTPMFEWRRLERAFQSD